jgi:hypothetical protein
MGLVALFAGLGVGFLQGIGRASRALQSASILAEAAYECKNRSIGGRTATLTLASEPNADGAEELVVTQSVQRPMLTAHFETPDWFVNAAGPAAATAEGSVSLEPEGKSGSAALFAQGGRLDFGHHPAFAPTDGIEIDVWVRPAHGRGAMVVLLGEEVYELSLLRSSAVGSATDAYGVQLRLRLVDADDPTRGSATTGAWTTFETEGSPVLAGRWSHVRASFDGASATIRVDGIDRTRADGTARGRSRAPRAGVAGEDAAAPVKWRRLATPSTGGVHLTLSTASGRPYVGAVDTLFVQGIFRSAEDRRALASGLSVETPRLPVTVRFQNGRLDPLVHRGDVAVVLVDDASPETERWLVRFGLYGVVSQPRSLLPGQTVEPPKPKATADTTAARKP